MIIKRVDESVTEYFFKHDYKDRGMLKWGGFFLSDHTSALQKMKNEKPEKVLPQQSSEKISSSLLSAWQSKRIVHVQLMTIKNEQVESYTGFVKGYNNEEIVFKLNDNNETMKALNLDEIRNVHNFVAKVWKNDDIFKSKK